MNLYLDTEFNGFGGELISMALAGDNDFWYEVRCIPNNVDPWVAEHVIPLLGNEPLGPDIFRLRFHEWIKKYQNPTIICDWHADAEHFCWMLAGLDYGSSLDFECKIVILKTPPGEPKPRIPHNALSDAAALRDWHRRQ